MTLLVIVMLHVLLIALVVAAKHIKLLRRDVETLFRLRAEDAARPLPVYATDPRDAADAAIDRHVQELHKSPR